MSVLLRSSFFLKEDEPVTSLPEKGQSKDEVLTTMQKARGGDVGWRDGKIFSLVYYGGEEASQVVKEAYTMFMSENALNPGAFPSLKKFESEVINMSASLLGGDEDVVGNMTSSGTESIVMAVYAAREWARANFPDTDPKCRAPEIVVPLSVHPAIEKAGHYFGVKVVHTPLGDDFRANVSAMRAAVTPATIMMVGSTPAYPHGLIDPIKPLAQIALKAGILFHVDACAGGFILPFVRKAGYMMPEFDFRVPGVTSISADLHKYGYAAKGASLILYRNKELRRHMMFAYMDWPGGIYATPTMTGTRPGGAIAAAWAILNYMGEDGYVRIARRVMETSLRIQEEIEEEMDGIHVVSDPEATIFAIASDTLNIYEVGDEMQARGWILDRQQAPPTLHVTLNQVHIEKEEDFVRDLKESVELLNKPSISQRMERGAMKFVLCFALCLAHILPKAWLTWLTSKASGAMKGGSGVPEKTAAMYGIMAELPNRGDLKELVLDLVEGFTDLEEGEEDEQKK